MNSIFKLTNDELETYIPKDKYIVCLCHHGVRSNTIANYLKDFGFNFNFLDL